MAADNVIKVWDLRNHRCIQTITDLDWPSQEDAHPCVMMYDTARSASLLCLPNNMRGSCGRREKSQVNMLRRIKHVSDQLWSRLPAVCPSLLPPSPGLTPLACVEVAMHVIKQTPKPSLVVLTVKTGAANCNTALFHLCIGELTGLCPQIRHGFANIVKCQPSY